MAKLKIGLDARLYGPTHRGLGRYTAELTTALGPLRQNYDFIFFVSNKESAALLEAAGWTTILAPYRVYSLTEQISFPRLIRRAQIDFMHFAHFNVPIICPVPYFVTVHDLILQHFPNRQSSTLSAFRYWFKYLVYRLVFRWVVERALAVICVSSFTAEDLLTLYPHLQSKVRVIKEPTPSFLELGNYDKNVFLSYTDNRPYVVTIGAFYPHKNLARLIRVWSVLKKQRSSLPDLILIGRLDSFAESHRALAESLGILNEPSGVRFAGFLPDSELVNIYRGSQFVILPSLWEGVGLTGLEALGVGAKLVSSAAAGLPETYGSKATYIAVQSDDEMLRSILKILDCFHFDTGDLVVGSSHQAATDRINLDQVTNELANTYREYIHANS